MPLFYPSTPSILGPTPLQSSDGMILFVLGLAGAFVAAYILHRKANNQRLVCPIGHDCDSVVHSEYNSLFGIPNEVLGLLYYGFVMMMGVLAYGEVWSLFHVSLFVPLELASLTGLVMSIYLTYLQVRVLKTYCSWCLTSALINVLIAGELLFAYLRASGM